MGYGFKHKGASDFSAFRYFCGKYLGTFLEWFTILFCFLVGIIMVSGAGATLNQYFGVPQIVGSGLMAAIVLLSALFGLKRIRRGMRSITGKDKRWGEIVMDSLFLGMVSAFVGMLFADIRSGLPGFIPIAVALVSALMMGVCGVLIKVCKMTWLEQYALPLCMLCAMALSIPLTALMA